MTHGPPRLLDLAIAPTKRCDDTKNLVSGNSLVHLPFQPASLHVAGSQIDVVGIRVFLVLVAKAPATAGR